MRQLTKTEIDNAPEWATHYFIHPTTDRFSYMSYYLEYFPNEILSYNLAFIDGVGKTAKPIPRKEFDIHQVRLSDSRIECLGHCTENTLFTYFNESTMELCETREDIIAKAKHFKLTAEDLR